MENTKIFKMNNSYILVELFEGEMVVKVKENGWSDIWSVPLVECDSFGRVELNTLTRLWEDAK